MPDRDAQIDAMRLQSARRKKALAILGLSDTADAETIKSAWRKQSHKCHPDHNPDHPDAHQKFILINCAYRFLTEGKNGEELDSGILLSQEQTGSKYRLDNSWGYFAWWKEKYFE